MFLFISALVLANATVVSHSTVNIEGEGSSHTFIQTTVNGNTTTVESNEPGSVSVEKTDSSENITSDVPVTVTHNPSSATTTEAATPEPEISVITTQSAHIKNVMIPPRHTWVAFLHTLWDRVKSILSFGILTGK